MKAANKPRINLENRTRLETVIPIPTPFVLFVDPASACNFRCSFCPTGDRELIRSTGRWQGAMDFDVFRKVIDDLAAFDSPLKVLRLYKEGEPLLNKRFSDMVAYAKQSGRVEYVDTTTNAYLLTPERSLEVIASGLDRINISVDGLSDKDYVKYTDTEVNFEKFVKNVKFFYENRKNCEVCIKMPGDLLSDAEKEFFFTTFGDIADRISLENFAPCWPEFDVEGNLGINITLGIYNNPIKEVDTCPYIFYSMAVNSDGSVSLCFLDWARKLPIGDVRTQSLLEIWQGEEMFNHRLAHLQGKRKDNQTCGSCGQLSHCLPDNIDPYVGELEKKLLASRPVKV
jgi:radical SAM protein with 4Fe4S-binding SPASM domain